MFTVYMGRAKGFNVPGSAEREPEIPHSKSRTSRTGVTAVVEFAPRPHCLSLPDAGAIKFRGKRALNNGRAVRHRRRVHRDLHDRDRRRLHHRLRCARSWGGLR